MTQGETFNSPNALVGLTAYDRTGEKIGSVERVYIDDATGRADWVTVKTGLFGMKESFVPLAGAGREDDTLKVNYTKEAVKDAPRVDADQHLEESEKQELYAHYGLAGPTAAAGGRAGRPD
ncbi:PRC-barrel domain containing protein, partial [Streptomyces sp. SID14478]|uniref:PRC-barrel domain-containing protein n=1 Tax=Streptomyces sp. SID14478 TaxID=2706073 RepID=UPI0013DCFC99